MADPETPPRDLWHTFLATHILSVEDEDAFLAYLTRPDETLPIDTMAALDAAYRRFLRMGHPHWTSTKGEDDGKSRE